MKKNIPAIKRLVIYLIVLGFLPALFLVYDYQMKSQRLTQLERQIETLRISAESKLKKQALNRCVRSYFCRADHYYIDQELEKLTLLTSEKAALQALISSKTFTGDPAVESRYAFLAGETNHLLFNEGLMQTGEGFQETLEILAHPVEVSGEDLQEILSRIDRKNEGQPQLIITDFRLEKKLTGLDNEIFNLNLKLLKREFLDQ